MKILMVTPNYDDRILALLEFKKLNMAHSIDFVSNGHELDEYVNSKTIRSIELPNLLLINSTIQRQDGIDPLEMITSNPEWMKAEVVVFSTSSNSDDIVIQQEIPSPDRTSDANELSWILKEICSGLANRGGWQYQIKAHTPNEGTMPC